MRTHISSPYLLRSSLFEHKPVFRPAGAVPKASQPLYIVFAVLSEPTMVWAL